MIKFKRKPQELKTKYPKVFGSVSFALIANELQTAPSTVFVGPKIDIDKFYTYLKTKGYKRDYKEMKALLLEAAPILGITNFLKLSKDEKQDLGFQEKYVYDGEISLETYNEFEIPAMSASGSDIVIRSMWGETEKAFYRPAKKMSEHEMNMLKVAYAYKYGDPSKTPWKNYLDARPATVGHIEKNRKSFDYTADATEFKGEAYN